MYFVTKRKGAFKYASAAKTIREGDKTRIDYLYIGRVIDLEKGIFYSRERQYFTYNIETNQFGQVDESFQPPMVVDKRTFDRKTLDFGDSYLLDQILRASGFWEVVDEIKWANKDTLHAMLLFYIESSLPNCDAKIWFEGNVAKMLYPGAHMEGEGISDFLEKIARADSLLAFQEKYVAFIFENYGKNRNILIDSMGVSNKGHVFLTQLSVHNNKVNVEARLVIVAQRSTGIHLYFKLFPGSIDDTMSMRTVFEHCQTLGIDIDECLLDAGYSTDINIDEFYDEQHHCIHEYITRPKSSASYYTKALLENLDTVKSKENFVQYEDRYFYIKHVEVMVGKNGDQPAHLYIGLDENRLSDELHKLLVGAYKKKREIGAVYDAMNKQGIFALLSGKKYEIEEILPEYYIRQEIEQFNDVTKNYPKLLPIKAQKQETFEGHVLLSMIANSVVRFIQIHLNESDLDLGSRLEAARNQKALLYKTKLVLDPPVKKADDMYTAFEIKVPTSLPIEEQWRQPKWRTQK